MLIYGYVKIILDSIEGTKKSYVQLAPARKRRDSMMYQDYENMFDSVVGAGGVDRNGEALMDEEEFLKRLSSSEDMNSEVFGIIAGADATVQFEPFTRVV